MNVDHRGAVANRKIGALASDPLWAWYQWQFIDPDAVQMTGCVSTGVWAKGPRKGRPKYDGEPVTVVVVDAEVETERARYEADTANCATCGGDGKEWRGCDHITGDKWDICGACGGTGSAKRTA